MGKQREWALSLLPGALRNRVAHAERAWRESRDALGCDVMVLSRAKSGRTWLRAMLSRLYTQHYGLEEAQLLDFDNLHGQDPAVPTVYFSHGHYLRARFGDPAWRRRFGERPVLFLVRHPCDVAVSEYFQTTRRASPRKVELHGADVDAELFEFVMTSPLGLPSIVDWLNEWAGITTESETTLMLRYEQLRADPERELERVAAFLGAPFSKEEIAEAVDFAAFENLKELERRNFFNSKKLSARDPEDPDSFKVRRGKVGGYADYFDAAQREAMESLVRERLDPVYGYSDGGCDPERP